MKLCTKIKSKIKSKIKVTCVQFSHVLQVELLRQNLLKDKGQETTDT